MFQRTDVMLESTAFAKVKAPSCYWMHLLSVDEFDAACVLCSFGDDQRTYILTPGQPVPMLRLGETGEPTMRDLRLRLPYGPRSRATLMFQLREPNPYKLTGDRWGQKYPIEQTALVAGGQGDVNNLITVPCRGMRSGVLAGSCPTATGQYVGAMVSVFCGSEDAFGGGSNFKRRLEIIPLTCFPPIDSAYARARAYSFAIPPGADWLRIRGWRYTPATAAAFVGTLSLSSAEPEAMGGQESDASSVNVPATGTVHIVGCVPVRDVMATGTRTLLRYRLANSGASPTNLQFFTFACNNDGKQSDDDDVTGLNPGAIAVAPAAIVTGNVAAYAADCWLIMAQGVAGAGQDVGSFSVLAS